ncbi:hypothetical protein D0863_07245 [Hortaea werneckii]|uniref:Heterokaryon incompatibility domain-containing protein n=1 Tax=Hortaea werneckii TaxID=91943 RepID=A0A3M7DVH9_HORWE|nr:hypothetical protein D0863_07245 [Hortaea werneckii]
MDALPLPSRLLLAGEEEIVLRETAEFPTSDTPYMALSYCWGGKDPAKTLRSNYQDRVKGMSVAALPRTYRQAIHLARQLGINHFWIDALCIVQDDNEDWQRDSSRMAEIYSGAYIVFVAAAAADVEGGLDPSADFKNCCYLTEHQVKAGSMWVRFKEHHFDACALLPISTRAWTYQERRLAKRCLIFGESEVVWECTQGCRCPCSATHTVARQSDPQLLPPVLSSGTVRKHFANSQDAYKFWSRAVQAFSKMQLTRPTDRLPAISAIASVIQAETGDQYLAGFWRSGLLKQLAWRCSDSGQIMNPPYDVYVAPSWSWLSLPRTVEVPEAGKPLQDKPQEACAEAEILQVHCKPVSLCSPLGAVQHGTLTLRGFCVWVKVQLNFWPGEPSCHKLSTISNKSEFLVQLALDYDGKIADAIHDPPPQRPSEMHAMPGARAEKHEVLDTAVKLLHLTGDFFLVLNHSRRERGKYVRVGTFSLHHDLINRDKAYRANVRKHLLGAANLEKVVVI